jgi:ADP-ribose pyrophosphatase YjhB (NUDIX family)
MNIDRHKIVPASYLILKKENLILLMRRFNTGYQDGNYSLPAGHVEKGESFTQCIIREGLEEIGINLKLEDLQVVHIINCDSKTKYNNERISIFFVAKNWNGKIKNMEPEKCDDLSWFDLGNLPENIAPEVSQALDNIKGDVFYSEYGWKNN